MLTPGTHRIETNGLELSVEIGGEGPPLLFMTPGFGPSIESYGHLRPLEERFTVIWAETRGTGRSDAPTDDDYRVASFTSDAEGLREALGVDRWWVAGHAVIGMVVQDYVAHHPDRCLGSIQVSTSLADDMGKVLEDGMARAGARAGDPLIDAALAAAPREVTTDAEALARITTMAPLLFHRPQDADRFLADAPGFTCRVAPMAVMDPSTFPSRTVTHLLEKVDVPTVIVSGASDVVCAPPWGQRVHHLMRGSKFVLVEEAGHFPWFEQPDRFWSGLDSGLAALE